MLAPRLEQTFSSTIVSEPGAKSRGKFRVMTQEGTDGIGGALDLWPGGCVPGRVGRDGGGAFGAKSL